MNIDVDVDSDIRGEVVDILHIFVYVHIDI